MAFFCGVGKTNISSGMNPCSCLFTSKCSPHSLQEGCSDKTAESSGLPMTDVPQESQSKELLDLLVLSYFISSKLLQRQDDKEVYLRHSRQSTLKVFCLAKDPGRPGICFNLYSKDLCMDTDVKQGIFDGSWRQYICLLPFANFLFRSNSECSSLACSTHLVQKFPLLSFLPRVDRRSTFPRGIASRLVGRECCLCWAGMGCFGAAFYGCRDGGDRQPCVLCSGRCGLSSFLALLLLSIWQRLLIFISQLYQGITLSRNANRTV